MFLSEQLDMLVIKLRKFESQYSIPHQYLDKFVNIFFDVINQTLVSLIQCEVKSVRAVESGKLEDGRQIFSFELGQNRIIFVPLTEVGCPVNKSVHIWETSSSGGYLGLASRLLIFLQPCLDRDYATVIYEIYVFSDGTWGGVGMFGEVSKTQMDKKVIRDFILNLIDSLINDLVPVWKEHQDISLASVVNHSSSQIEYQN